jgi:hypothetical protein
VAKLILTHLFYARKSIRLFRSCCALLSNVIAVHGDNFFELVVVGLLVDDISEVVGIFPEDDDHDHLEDQRDVAKESSKSAQFVFVAAVFLVFFLRALLDQEKREEVIDPGADDKKHELSEGVPLDVL